MPIMCNSYYVAVYHVCMYTVFKLFFFSFLTSTCKHTLTHLILLLIEGH